MTAHTLRYVFLPFAALGWLCAAQGQALYKWVDAQGGVSYSDKPPPPALAVKDLSSTLNVLGAGAAQAQGLNYDTQQQVQKAPIVLYTSKGCALCDTGRALLAGKMLPYTEKTVNNAAQVKALYAQFATQNVPVLAVGSAAIKGFGVSQWEEALTAAGYKDSHAVPKSYVNGAVEPLGGAAATTGKDTPTAANPSPNPNPNPTPNPAGKGKTP
jgi:Domain of unknown function (DUF4124)